MVDDHEALDWGGEDDEHLGEGAQRSAAVGDVDDVVSIGGEEDDMQEKAAFQSRTMQDNENDVAATATLKQPPPESVARSGGHTPKRDAGEARTQAVPPLSLPQGPVAVSAPPPTKTSVIQTPEATKTSSRSESSPRPMPIKAPMTHALPPKPTVTPVLPSRSSSFIGASAMSEIRRDSDRDRKRANGAKLVKEEVLPPDWEIRRSSAGETYYYNTRTFVSQWERPNLDGKASSPKPRVSDTEGFPNRHAESELDKTRSTDDLRAEKIREPQRGDDRAQALTAVQELSYDDRHYRPSNGLDTSRVHRRERRGHSPVPAQTQNTYRGDSSRVVSTLQGKENIEKDVSRPYEPWSEADEARTHRRPSPESSGFRRSNLRDSGTIRVIREVGFDRPADKNPRRGRPQGDRTQEPRSASDRSGFNSYTPTPLRESSRTGDNSLLSSQRRNRSRSPLPQVQIPASVRGGDASRSHEGSLPEHNAYQRLPGTDRPSKPGTEQSLPPRWDKTPSAHREAGTSMEIDLPVRRSRDAESTVTDFGMDAKRRRLDNVTTDSTRGRRGRSPSPIGIQRNAFRSDSYPEHRTERYGNANDGRRSSGVANSYDLSARDEGWSTRKSGGVHATEVIQDSTLNAKPINNGSSSHGSRRRTDSLLIHSERRETDEGRRAMDRDDRRAYDPKERRDESDSRSYRPGMNSSAAAIAGYFRDAIEPMDIDHPHIRATGLTSNVGSTYSGRVTGVSERQDINRPPIVPQGSRSRNGQLSPAAPVPPALRADRTAPPVGGDRHSSPSDLRGRRGSIPDEVESRRQQESRSVHIEERGTQYLDSTDGSVARGSSKQIPGDWKAYQRTDIPRGPSFLVRQMASLEKPSPKLTGANNVPVPPRKGWKVEGSVEAGATTKNGKLGVSEEQGRLHTSDIEDVSADTRYTSLHGDVERRMSFIERNEKSSSEVVASGHDHEWDLPEKPIHTSQDSRRSGKRAPRSSNSKERSTPTNESAEPRLWISREDANNMRGLNSPRDPPARIDRRPKDLRELREPDTRPRLPAESRERRIAEEWRGNPTSSSRAVPTEAKSVNLPAETTRREAVDFGQLTNTNLQSGRSQDTSIGPVHPSRLSNVTAATSPSKDDIKQDGSSKEQRRAPHTKRPQSRFADVFSGGQVHTAVPQTDVKSQFDSQGQPRPNSLLERLGMNKDGEPGRDATTSSGGPATEGGNTNYTDGLEGEHGPTRVRNRGGRNRRGKGRNRFGDS